MSGTSSLQHHVASSAGPSSSSVDSNKENGSPEERSQHSEEGYDVAARKTGEGNALRPKRSTLFFASPAFKSKSNRQPFSKSAEKRESVMALGTIAHLQAYYAKQGLAARTAPSFSRGGGAKPALGPAALAAARSAEEHGDGESSNAGLESVSPTSRMAGTDEALAALEGRSTGRGDSSSTHTDSEQGIIDDTEAMEVTRSTWKGRLYSDIAKPVEADIQRLWQIMMARLDQTCQAWDLIGVVKSIDEHHDSTLALDVPDAGRLSQASRRRCSSTNLSSDGRTSLYPLDLINDTTATIRSVRNFLFALPPNSVRLSTSAPADSKHGEQATQDGSANRLTRRPSFQLRSEPHTGVKSKDAYKRQSSFGMPRGSAPPGGAGASGTGSVGKGSESRAPSSFVPFETVRRMSVDLSQKDESSHRRSPSTEPEPRIFWLASRTEGATAAVSSGCKPTDDSADAPDPLVVVRAVALEVLGVLKDIELRSRVDVDVDADATGVLTDRAHMMREYSESSAPVDSGVDATEDVPGFQYVPHITLASVAVERETVRRYLSTVDTVLSGLKRPLRGGRPSTRVSIDAKALPPSSDDSREASVNDWASISFCGSLTDRLLGMLRDVLAEFSVDLADLQGREEVLTFLSDGQVLCHAYNAALRRSPRPWGFIQSDSVHDVKGEEAAFEAEQRQQPPKAAPPGNAARPSGWTFRRVENLKRFHAAVTLRYGLRSSPPSSLPFDAVKIARRETTTAATATAAAESHEMGPSQKTNHSPAWMNMLEGFLAAWLDKVAEEENAQLCQ